MLFLLFQQATGIAAFAFFGWMLTDTSFLFSITQKGPDSYIGLLVFVGIATLVLIIAFLGCCGALKESQCMLVSVSCIFYDFLVQKSFISRPERFFPAKKMRFLEIGLIATISSVLSLQFFCFLFIVLVAEIATGVYAYLHQDQLLKTVKADVKQTVQHDYSVIGSKTLLFDVFQKNVSLGFIKFRLDFHLSIPAKINILFAPNPKKLAGMLRR